MQLLNSQQEACQLTAAPAVHCSGAVKPVKPAVRPVKPAAKEPKGTSLDGHILLLPTHHQQRSEYTMPAMHWMQQQSPQKKNPKLRCMSREPCTMLDCIQPMQRLAAQGSWSRHARTRKKCFHSLPEKQAPQNNSIHQHTADTPAHTFTAAARRSCSGIPNAQQPGVASQHTSQPIQQTLQRFKPGQLRLCLPRKRAPHIGTCASTLQLPRGNTLQRSANRSLPPTPSK